jgi:membrane-bound lytic murein transglycosylase A
LPRKVLEAAAAAALLLALFACVPRPPPPPRLTLTPARFADLAAWNDDAQSAALAAFARSCAVLAKRPPAAAMGAAGHAADWQAPCAALPAAADNAAARRFFETWFQPWQAGNNGATQGLFTGYYEPELDGSLAPGGAYATPLLRRPPDLVMVDLGLFRPALRGERIAGRVVDGRLKPYDSRAAIERGALDRYHLAFLWVDDPIAAFFLQIQGSGRVRLPDGRIVQVGYDGQNGWPYVAIGKLLVAEGALSQDEVSLQSIRAWLKAHPDRADAVMAENPSYVFFRELTGDGPIGSEGVVLTPGRSLAVDSSFVPLGVPVFVDAGEGLRRLMVAQDTGGAIRGPVRGDVFWGAGAEAESRAGTMRLNGAYYLLLPKGVTPVS